MFGYVILHSFIGKDREPLIRDPLVLGSLSLIEAILSLVDSYMSLVSLIKAIVSRVSKWGSLSFPMTVEHNIQDPQFDLLRIESVRNICDIPVYSITHNRGRGGGRLYKGDETLKPACIHINAFAVQRQPAFILYLLYSIV